MVWFWLSCLGAVSLIFVIVVNWLRNISISFFLQHYLFLKPFFCNTRLRARDCRQSWTKLYWKWLPIGVLCILNPLSIFFATLSLFKTLFFATRGYAHATADGREQSFTENDCRLVYFAYLNPYLLVPRSHLLRLWRLGYKIFWCSDYLTADSQRQSTNFYQYIIISKFLTLWPSSSVQHQAL